VPGYRYPLPRAYRRPRYPYRYRKGGGHAGVAAIAIGAALVASAGARAAAGTAHHPAQATAPVQAPAPAPASANAALGQQMAAAPPYDWTGGQWACLDWLWTRESGWRMVWNFQGSGAYGIPQSLPAGKMAAAGPDYMTSPATQIKWGLGYVAATYGTPCNAWGHETTDGWY
jgi:hypothetical protein